MKKLIFVKILFAGGINGIVTALSFMLAHDALTTDSVFTLWEFGIASCMPVVGAILIARFSKLSIRMLLPIAYLTLLIPVLGASFGASGAEPLWQYAILGLAGGLVWSIPVAGWSLLRRRGTD